MKLLLIEIPRLAKIFSRKSLYGVVTNIFLLSYFVVSRKISSKQPDYKFKAYYNNREIVFFLRYPMDIAVLVEIFLLKEYEWCPMQQPQVIVDLGGHYGDTALYYHARFPDAKIISVEPSPENFERLQKHVKDIENILPIHAAIGKGGDEIELTLQKSTLGHSLFRQDNNLKKVFVKLISLTDLVNQYSLTKIDLLKFDIEGAEFSVFEGLPVDFPITAMTGELHFDLVQGYSLEKVKKLLYSYDVEVVPLSNQNRFLMTALSGAK